MQISDLWQRLLEITSATKVNTHSELLWKERFSKEFASTPQKQHFPPSPRNKEQPWWYRVTPGMTCHLLSHLHFSGQLVGSPSLCPARQKVNMHPKRRPAKEWDDKKWQFLPSFPSTPFICEQERRGPHLPLVCADGPAWVSRFIPKMKPTQYLHSCGVRDTVALTQKSSNCLSHRAMMHIGKWRFPMIVFLSDSFPTLKGERQSHFLPWHLSGQQVVYLHVFRARDSYGGIGTAGMAVDGKI